MDINVKHDSSSGYTGQVIVINIFEDLTLGDQAAKLDQVMDGALAGLLKQGEIKGKFKEITTVYTMGKIAPKKIVIAGMGKQSELNLDKIRAIVAEIIKKVKNTNCGSICETALALDITGFEQCDLGQVICEGIVLGLYTFKNHITAKSDITHEGSIDIILSKEEYLSHFRQGVEKGFICAESVVLSRDMVNEPANYMTPSILADLVLDKAAKYGLNIQVLERDFMQREGMGGILGVSQGSVQPPKFIVLKYLGKDNQDIDIALVGKGITFDSGGISLKPSENMGEMKGDMAGGASVIGAIIAAARLKLAINILAIIPATENLPGGAAMRPGDIITQMNGKTVEIISTDAEGRLILADAICYARKQGVKRILDVATLTGSCRVALGDVCTGVFGNDQNFTSLVTAAGDKSGECLWPFPMKEEYRELNKSDVADIKNSGGRYAGAISAAWFIAEFAENIPWVHLDIAGTSMVDKERGYISKGATGIPVRSLINLVISLADKK
jgi:leucyl aminopeptidase